MKRIAILGSTGSIGTSCLDVVSGHRDSFRVAGLAAGRNIDLLEKQIKTFCPEIVAVADEAAAVELRKRIGTLIEIRSGDAGIMAVAAHGDSDFVLSAMVGFKGLFPTLEAIKAGKTIGLANKETLVAAGGIVMNEAEARGTKILPVDSEHSAIFQCIEGRDMRHVKRVILTASGGPFFGKNKKELMHVNPEDALRHPRWSMGKKVTVDSATLMNKGLEIIEASHLFGLDAERIDVLVHPQSIVHSMVEFIDNGLLAQVSMPDMKGPIAYALSYPERLRDIMRPLEFSEFESLTFHKPDTENFPCLNYAYEALRESGTMPAVLNASNETAVNAFLCGRINFNDIPVIINKTMLSHKTIHAVELEDIVDADRRAREKAEEYIKKT